MWTKSKVVLAAALLLVMVIGIAAYAQTAQPRMRTQKPNAPAQMDKARGEWAGLADFDPGTKEEAFYRFVNLQRFLRPPNRRELERLSVILGLTEQQKQQIRAVYQQFFATVKPIYLQRGEATREVLTILSGPSPSRDALESASAKVEQADRAILSAEFDFWIAFRQILSPQQQTQVQSLLQQRMMMEAGPNQPRPGAPAPPTQ